MVGNHQKYLTFGEDLVVEVLESKLKRSLSSIRVAQEILPIWTDWGVQDSDVWVHSLGITFWAALGQKLGYVAISEVPAIPLTVQVNITVAEKVRSDSAWFDSNTRKPTVLVEFERYSGTLDNEKLISKVKNLLLAHRVWNECPELLILAYWTKGLTPALQYDSLRNIFCSGFETNTKSKVFGSSKGKLIFYQFILQEHKQNFLKLTEIVERGT